MLNLIQPGLGLLRLGAGRIGAFMIVLPLIWLLASKTLFATAPTANFATIVIYVAVTLVCTVVLYVTSIVLTWRRSALISVPLPWWSRWYAFVVIAIVVGVATNFAAGGVHRFYKPFYIPSENMAPNLGKLDHMIADMRAIRDPAVGDIVLIRSGSTTYVKRVVGLPGDRVSMIGDIPVINGVRAHLQEGGSTQFFGTHGYESAKLFHEQMPHEIGSHDIIISKQTARNRQLMAISRSKLFRRSMFLCWGIIVSDPQIAGCHRRMAG